MKKVLGLLFGLICGLMFVLAVAPAQAHAEENYYYLSVNGKMFTSEHKVIECGDGTATLETYSPDGNVIILDNCSIGTGSIKDFTNSKSLTLKIKGRNNIMVIDEDMGMCCDHDLCIEGIGDDALLGIFCGGKEGYSTSMVDTKGDVYLKNVSFIVTAVKLDGYLFNNSVYVDNASVEGFSGRIINSEEKNLILVTDSCDYKVMVSEDQTVANSVEWDGSTSLKNYKYLNIIPVPKKVKHYDVFVNGEEFTDNHTVISCGSGTATLDTLSPEGYVLTLDNCTIDAGPIKKSSPGSLIIKINGHNEISLSDEVLDTSDSFFSVQINGAGSLIGIGDDASLSVSLGKSSKYWIKTLCAYQKLDIKNLKLYAATTQDLDSAVFDCSIEVEDSTIECCAGQIMTDDISFAKIDSDYEILFADNMEGNNPVKWDGVTSLSKYKYMRVAPVSKEGSTTDSDTEVPEVKSYDIGVNGIKFH